MLLLVLLVQTFSAGFVVLNFYANRSYIAQNLCENRSKPQLNCCGKCQLNKKLRQEENKDQDSNGRKSIEINAGAFDAVTADIVILHYTPLKVKWPGIRTIGRPVDMPAGYFHPPDKAGLC
ncbi:hypothetical protein [Deminuibacter soli]|uniref:Uncharacterized protein n=1 Tax=Deminuibacter soli TaxID=2291815 RepID=A0A3E1NGK8_9BACT|nr:hypothetical protein [Deminuibacter soli]RFM27085.1 hypothetical protein DXN05_16595 [Deminuibacter soli]